MTRFLVIPLRVPEDETFARYALQAAHSRREATVVLDLSDGPPAASVDWLRVLGEFRGTAVGNGHGFRLVAPEANQPRAVAAAAALVPPVPCHDDLSACLAAVASPPAEGRFEADLTLPARVEYLAPLRTFLASAVRLLHGDAEAFRAEILVDELGLNAVENSPSDRNAYDIRFRVGQDSIDVQVTNDFDGSVNSERIMQRRVHSFDASGDYLGERGRGLFLIARLADGLQIRAVEGERIRVSVTRRVGQAPGEAAPVGPAVDASAKTGPAPSGGA